MRRAAVPTASPAHPVPPTLFARPPTRPVRFPIQSVVLDWDRLAASRTVVLQTVAAMPRYLLKPEVLTLLGLETDPRYRLILDLMWTTGGRVSKVLALTPAAVVDDGYLFGVIYRTLKQHSGHARPRAGRADQRFVPIADERLQERLRSYLWSGQFKQGERLFALTRQTVTRHIHVLVERAGGAPFNITAHTFRHAFAIHLLLHGRPLKVVSQLLGHHALESTEIYTNVLTVDAAHFLDGVDFH